MSVDMAYRYPIYIAKVVHNDPKVPDGWVHYTETGKQAGKIWIGPPAPVVRPVISFEVEIKKPKKATPAVQ